MTVEEMYKGAPDTQDTSGAANAVSAAATPYAAGASGLPSLRYNQQGLIGAIVQQYDTGEVLMFAWMNEESLSRTLSTRQTWFWSRSRQELWNKGATSGNAQQLKAIYYDCDEDCLLLKVDSPGVACHTGERSCFYRTLELPENENLDG